MAILSFRRYAEMPEAERLRRIGELIATAVIRYEREQRSVAPVRRGRDARREEPENPANLVTDQTEKEIVRYLARVGGATPRDLCIALGLSGITITRKLARLRVAGLLTVRGKTRAACYRLRSEFERN